jgi:hypothetical protein
VNVTSYYICAPDVTSSRAKFTFDEFMDIFCTAVYNLPQYGDLRTAIGYSYNPRTGLLTAIQPQYLADYDDAAYNRAIDVALSKTIAPGMSDLEKLLSIHDYLVNNTTYSTTTANSVYTPYGVLVNHDAVCQGYSMAFKALCDRIGITCGYAVSTVQDHMWNLIEYNGKYYHLDATWDDPVMANGTQFTLHEYFLISDSENQSFRSYSDTDWTTTLPVTCDDEAFHSTLYVADKVDPFIWQGDCFWYKCTGKLLSTGIGLYSTPKYYKYKDNAAKAVTEAAFMPENALSSHIYYSVDGKVAIDGEADSSADLYAVVLDDNGNFEGVKKITVTFDENGSALVEPGDYSKLMLFTSDGLTPLSYASNR